MKVRPCSRVAANAGGCDRRHYTPFMFDRALIETFAAGGDTLREAIRGLSDEQMRAYPIPGTWSIQQIVVHLADSDAVAVDRMKRVAAMSSPLLMGYDENAFMTALHPEAQPIEEVLELFDLNRRLWAITLRKLPDEAFERTGIHSERGKLSLGHLVKDYIWHLDHHLGFVRKKRALLEQRG